MNEKLIIERRDYLSFWFYSLLITSNIQGTTNNITKELEFIHVHIVFILGKQTDDNNENEDGFIQLYIVLILGTGSPNRMRRNRKE